MSIAAVPGYLGQDFRNASPGMRFGMYLKLWGENHELRRADWRTSDRIWSEYKKHPRWEDEDNKRAAIDAACTLSSNDKAIMSAIRVRQKAMALAAADVLIINAQSTAPFTTGLGNEHPLENGFAFLWPYGLPYLPGSGVKGVLRQAARELSSEEWGENPWHDLPGGTVRIGDRVEPQALHWLFGQESQDHQQEHCRGVLSFWDVIPEIRGDRLMVEIMTPHQKHYYQEGNPPHDCGQPNPISFLTVPPGSKFIFHVQCDRTRLAPELAENDLWKELLQAAFEHAFEWLGFGAKTAVGYGAMESSAEGDETATDAAEPSLETTLETWEKAMVRYNPGSQELSAVFQGQTALLQGSEAKQLVEAQDKSLARQFKRGCVLTVRVERMGNRILLRELVVKE